MEFERATQKSITVDPESLKENQNTHVKIDFMDKDVIKDFIKSPTKESDNSTGKEDPFKGKTAEEAAEYVKKEENTQVFTPDDLRDVSTILVMMYDIGLSTSLKLFAGDDIDTPYTIAAPKLRKLENILTMVLVKYQTKFKVEFLFLLSLIIISWSPITIARKNRKAIKLEKQRRKQREDQQAEYLKSKSKPQPVEKEPVEELFPEPDPAPKPDDYIKSSEVVEPSEIFTPPSAGSPARVVRMNKVPRRGGKPSRSPISTD